MKILLIEPYYTGSHKQWADGYKAKSQHDVTLLKLSGHYWKWRMHGGAITLARKYLDGGYAPDLILASAMLDTTTFLSLTREATSQIPIALYFHENQLTYPWSKTDRDVVAGRNNHYGFINYSSALACDRLFFNSRYHLDSFADALPSFLKGFPDHNELGSIEKIKRKSEVLSLGMDLAKFDQDELDLKHPGTPVVLWNHRWEYDKNPTEFFQALLIMKERGIDFKLVVLGENFSQQPEVFEKAKLQFADNILHYGYVKDFKEYASYLQIADILPVTSNQDFFGGGAVEAMYCNVRPLLPNRLAFPGHLPPKFHKKFLYNGFDELVEKLSKILSDFPSEEIETREWVSKYDWSIMAPVYDSRMEKMV